jgi:hypothetical protein
MDLDLKHCCKSVSGRIDFNTDPDLDQEGQTIADPDMDLESQTNADTGQAFGVTLTSDM